jgi:hypothetical protein
MLGVYMGDRRPLSLSIAIARLCCMGMQYYTRLYHWYIMHHARVNVSYGDPDDRIYIYYCKFSTKFSMLTYYRGGALKGGIWSRGLL